MLEGMVKMESTNLWDVSSIKLNDYYLAGEIIMQDWMKTIELKRIFIGRGYNVRFVWETIKSADILDEQQIMQGRCILQSFLIQKRNKRKNFYKKG